MADIARAASRHGHWLVVVMIGACAVAAACSEAADPAATNDADAGSSGGDGVEEERDAAPIIDFNTSSSGALPPDSGIAVDSTAENLRVAFIGDTDNGADFKKVLDLVKKENAQLLMVQGDITYDGHKGADWFPVIDAALNTDGGVKIPYIVSKGNHDTDWTNIAAGLKTRYAAWGIAPDSNEASTRNYSLVYKGLRVVMVDQAETTPLRADYVKSQLETDTHVWKVCSWHKNMRASNVGPKSDEMRWPIYDTCRAYGALVAQGHSHTYSRSKTIVDDATQKLDTTCADPFALCVGPGKHFFFDSSVGGHDLRDVEAEWADKPHMAASFSSSYGALFIDFHVDGDPKKARGYFKTIAGNVIDPPASSGKTAFEITSSN